MVNASFVEPISVGPEGTKATMLFSPGNSPYAEFVVGPAIAGDCGIKGLKAAGEFVVLPRAEFDALVPEGFDAAAIANFRQEIALALGHITGKHFDWPHLFAEFNGSWWCGYGPSRAECRACNDLGIRGTFNALNPEAAAEAFLVAVQAVAAKDKAAAAPDEPASEMTCDGCGCSLKHIAHRACPYCHKHYCLDCAGALMFNSTVCNDCHARYEQEAQELRQKRVAENEQDPNFATCIYCGMRAWGVSAEDLMHDKDKTTCNACFARREREAMETRGEKKLDRVWSEQIAKLIEGVQPLLDLYPEEDALAPLSAALREFNRQCIAIEEMMRSIGAPAKADRDGDFSTASANEMRAYLDLRGRLGETEYSPPTLCCATLYHKSSASIICYVEKQCNRWTALHALCEKVAALEVGE